MVRSLIVNNDADRQFESASFRHSKYASVSFSLLPGPLSDKSALSILRGSGR